MPPSCLPAGMAIKANAQDAPDLANWRFPTGVFLDSEYLQVCSYTGDVLNVCPGGRGAGGTKPADHNPNVILQPDQQWAPAASDLQKSLHPRFILTFYPGWDGVKVEAIVENVWSNKLQNQGYRALLLEGEGAAAKPVWDAMVSHYAGARWRQVFWSGNATGDIRVDLNFPYLVYSRAVPSYDLNLNLPQSTVLADRKLFDASDRGENMGSGTWTKYFPAPGGRPDIGLLPRWDVTYLYSWDEGLHRMILGNGEAGAHIPTHFRESLYTNRKFESSSDASAFGRVISIDARPTVRTMIGAWAISDTALADRITTAGPSSAGSWSPDLAHQAEFAYFPYLVTGDYYFLEELQFWAANDLAWSQPASVGYGRGGSMGYIYDQIRGEGWALRTLALAAAMSPDGTPEKTYFTQKLQNNIAVREGKLGFTGGMFYEPAENCPFPCKATRWRYGRDLVARGLENPLRFIETNFVKISSSAELVYVDPEKTFSLGNPWMVNYKQCVLAWIDDLGFNEIRPFRHYVAGNLIPQVLHPDYNPYLATEYRTPMHQMSDQGFFKSWADVKAGYSPTFQAEDAIPAGRLTLPSSYAYILRAALAGASDVALDDSSTGLRAFEWLNGKLKPEILRSDPTWAMVPRLWPNGPRPSVEPKALASAPQPKWFKRPKVKAKGGTVAAAH